ncbi:hypothetical protein [Vreelandella titanicae]
MPHAPRIELHPVNQRMQVHVDLNLNLVADSIQALELRELSYLPAIISHLKTCRWICLPFQKPRPTAHLKVIRCFSGWVRFVDIDWSYEQLIDGMEAIVGRLTLAGVDEEFDFFR